MGLVRSVFVGVVVAVDSSDSVTSAPWAAAESNTKPGHAQVLASASFPYGIFRIDIPIKRQ